MASWGLRYTRTLPSARTNWYRDSSDHSTCFQSSMVQLATSQAQVRRCVRCLRHFCGSFCCHIPWELHSAVLACWKCLVPPAQNADVISASVASLLLRAIPARRRSRSLSTGGRPLRCPRRVVMPSMKCSRYTRHSVDSFGNGTVHPSDTHSHVPFNFRLSRRLALSRLADVQPDSRENTSHLIGSGHSQAVNGRWRHLKINLHTAIPWLLALESIFFLSLGYLTSNDKKDK
jgi:hypothetical protein